MNREEFVKFVEEHIDIASVSIYRRYSASDIELSGIRLDIHKEDIACGIRIEYKVSNNISLYVIMHDQRQVHTLYLTPKEFNHIIFLIEDRCNMPINEFSDGIIDYIDEYLDSTSFRVHYIRPLEYITLDATLTKPKGDLLEHEHFTDIH